jgi:hypothetical protein
MRCIASVQMSKNGDDAALTKLLQALSPEERKRAVNEPDKNGSTP